MTFLRAAFMAFIFYILLVAFSGDILLWSRGELIAGVGIAILVGIATNRAFFPDSKSPRILNPWRWLLFIFYSIGPFFIALARANLDVARRVITGEIRPGIVKITPGLKTDLGITFLANSITLTPGTLSVDIDEDTNEIYVHSINVKNPEPKIEEVCGRFHVWIRRITE